MTINDADREAAVELAFALGISAEDFTSGAADILVRDFRARRLAERERILAYIKQYQEWHDRHDDGLSGFDRMAQTAQELFEGIDLGDHEDPAV